MTDWNAMDAAWAANHIAAFDRSGLHRIGQPGDVASGEWLAREAAASGLAVSRSEVLFERTDVEEAWIECAGRRIDGLPIFDAPATPGTGITGALGASGSKAVIGLAEFPPNAASIKGQPFEQLRRTTRHAALVVATRVSGDSLAPINAQYYDALFGPPVLLVAGMHHAFLEAQAAAGSAARLCIHRRRTPAASYNLIAEALVTGAAPPLAIVTPRTGWWESTAERSGGLVAWLAALHAAGALQRSGSPRRSVRAFATCGHELGHLGLHALTRAEPALVRDAGWWLHLGANLGGAGNEMLMVRAADAGEAGHMRDLLAEAGYPPSQIRVEPAEKFSGEGHDLAHLGARVLSLAGSNLHFHAASDRWPGNVNAANVSAIARAVARWVGQRAA